MSDINKILIYTDGSALGNPGPGGYGIIMKTTDGKLQKNFSKGFKRTTNNRMELMAVIDALKKIKDKNLPVEIYSDSKYVVDAIRQGLVHKWKANRFAKTKNPDLWHALLKVSEDVDYQIFWIKGHNNHTENEICDRLAVTAAKKEPVHEDTGYEQILKNKDNKLF